jgi:hypothetical protein
LRNTTCKLSSDGVRAARMSLFQLKKKMTMQRKSKTLSFRMQTPSMNADDDNETTILIKTPDRKYSAVIPSGNEKTTVELPRKNL